MERGTEHVAFCIQENLVLFLALLSYCWCCHTCSISYCFLALWPLGVPAMLLFILAQKSFGVAYLTWTSVPSHNSEQSSVAQTCLPCPRLQVELLIAEKSFRAGLISVVLTLALLNFSRQTKNRGCDNILHLFFTLVYLNGIREVLYQMLFSFWWSRFHVCFWQAKLLQLSGKLQVLSENVFIQLLTDIQGFNAEILPCAPCGCGSEEENTARDERLKGEGSVLIVHPPLHFSVQQGYRGGKGLKEIIIFMKLPGVFSSLHLPMT